MLPKIINKIQELRNSLLTADPNTIKTIAAQIEALESFMYSYKAFGMDKAIEKMQYNSLQYLLGIDDELTTRAQSRIDDYKSLLPNIKTALSKEIKEVFASCGSIDFTDIKQLSAWDVKHEELHSLRYYLNQIDFYTLPAWCENIHRMDTELIRRCFLHLPQNQRAILERYL